MILASLYRVKPICFKDRREFRQFTMDVAKAAKDTGACTDQLVMYIVGGQVHGWTSNVLKDLSPWNSQKDLDVAVIAPDVVREYGYKLDINYGQLQLFKSNGISGFYSQVPFGKALKEVSREWSQRLRRPVSFKLQRRDVPPYDWEGPIRIRWAKTTGDRSDDYEEDMDLVKYVHETIGECKICGHYNQKKPNRQCSCGHKRSCIRYDPQRKSIKYTPRYCEKHYDIHQEQHKEFPLAEYITKVF